MFGSQNSDNYVVIYDKQHTEGVEFPWLRVEMRITNRRDCAAIVQALIDGSNEGELFAGLLKNKLDFKEDGEKPKYQRQTMQWWDSFLNGVSSRRLKRPPRRRNPLKYLHDSATKTEKYILRALERQDFETVKQIFKKVDYYRFRLPVLDEF
jgi:DNA relaxase NicK